ncbi:toprim domain-containing protein [uncultured Chryseobacterium sp.]|uniref:toprim domain-containing protein n=1 Tax=uncultured Chryseobacterium sp. TaxID=259322 RepID=UPI0025E3C559|nr:toprim domain-containing protein [uncultured Chryseobacterium sp.]
METWKLILAEAIIDTASLLQIKNFLENYTVIAFFGTNGLNEEIPNTIKELTNSDRKVSFGYLGYKKIVFCFDNDETEKLAVEKYSKSFSGRNLRNKNK